MENLRTIPSRLALIAGKGVYPLLLAESARKRGVGYLQVIAFRGETNSRVAACADDTHWIHVGQLGRMLAALSSSGADKAVMAGQITPTNLFRVRMDGPMLSLLRRLPVRNAETLFGAVADELKAIGIDLLPASAFMEDYMPAAGVISPRAPSESERGDIRLGWSVAQATSGLDIGQTVVIREGTVLAVEAFEGTDAAIRRAGKLGGAGCVVVKRAKQGHDMRFDIPVIGMQTMKTLRKVKAAAMAVEAGRCIILERERIVEEARKLDIALIAVDTAAVAGEGSGQ